MTFIFHAGTLIFLVGLHAPMQGHAQPSVASANASSRRLWEALQKGDASQALALTAQGVQAPGVDANGLTALMYVSHPRLELSEEQRLTLAQRLLSGGSPLGKRDGGNRTALLLAMREKCWSLAAWMVDQGGEDLEAQVPNLEDGDEEETPFEERRSALSWAASRGQRNLVERLLKAGAQVNGRSALGVTPLLAAASRPDIAQLLLDRGTDPKSEDEARRGLVEHAVMAGAPWEVVDRWAKLCAPYVPHPALPALAAASPEPRRLLDVLARGWGDVNEVPGTGHTALAQVVQDNHPELVEALLKAGASPLQPSLGRTPLGLALASDRHALALVLLKPCPPGSLFSWLGGPDYLVEACRVSREGSAQETQKRLIRLLLDKGASPEEGQGDRSARALAAKHGLAALLPPPAADWEPCGHPVRACRGGARLEAIPSGALPPTPAALDGGPLPIRPAGASFHPKNKDHLPEVGAGSHGYGFCTRPGAFYRLFVEGEKQPIPGLPNGGILHGVADAKGRTAFVRMPKAVAAKDWILMEMVGEDPRHDTFGKNFLLSQEGTGEPILNAPYLLEMQDGPVYCGKTDVQGNTAYMTGASPRNVELSVLESSFSDEAWESAKLLLQAKVYGTRKKDLEANLARIEGLFRESLASFRRLDPGPSEERDADAEAPRSARETARWRAFYLPCTLRAWRAAFLALHERLDLAQEDVTHLVTCPHLDADATVEPLEHLLEGLKKDPARQSWAHRLQAKAQALRAGTFPSKSTAMQQDSPQKPPPL